ncbi:MAG: sulfatase family protein [Blastocatellia bacterium]
MKKMIQHKLTIIVGGIAALLIALSAPTFAQGRKDAAQKPNVVVILADDFGYGSTNAYGADPKLVRTPNLDRLAKEGRRFTDANTTSSVCSPTRYALMTGRYAWRTSLKFGVLPWSAPLHIETTRPNLAALFKKHGYQTAAIGKWHLGYGTGKPDYTSDLKPGPLELGFDYHFAVPSNHGDVTGVFIENHGVAGLRSTNVVPIERLNQNNNRFLGLDAPQREDEEVMETLTDKSIGFIEKRDKAKPFFLYYTPVAVHEPVTPSKRTAGSSAAGPYGDWIHELDRSIGRLLDALDKQGLTKDTLILFTADNGGVVNRGNARLAAHTGRAQDAGLKINGELRLGKHSVFQGGFQVPYLVRWPGKVAAGSVSDEPLSLVDTYATLSALLGEKLPAKELAAEDSYNMLPAWLEKKTGKKTKAQLRPHVITHSADGTFAIREGKWKWIEGREPSAKAVGGRAVRADEMNPQLYDLQADRAESKDAIAQQADVVKRLSALLKQIRQQGFSR